MDGERFASKEQVRAAILQRQSEAAQEIEASGGCDVRTAATWLQGVQSASGEQQSQ